MNHWLPLACCLLGFGALALAMDRPQDVVFGHGLRRPQVILLRLAGTAALLLALGWLVGWQGWGLGLVMFSGHTSLAAGAVLCALIMLERWRHRG